MEEFNNKIITKAAAIKNFGNDSAESTKITATGQGAIAEQIINIAFANDIKVRKDADLVEILSAIDVNSPIPAAAIAAIAEILAYLYEANKETNQ